ncbi:hypothetical protein FRB99_006562, partial [Tulasnella sp. 403]
MSSSSLDYAANAYLAVTIHHNSPFFAHPTDLPSVPLLHPYQLSYVGNVGQLDDTHLYSVPKSTFESVKSQIYGAFDKMQGDVASVDIQIPKQRNKRNE